MVLGDRNAACSSSTCVDSALPGSHDFASFFSAPDSLPASGPAAATTMTQNSNTRYLVRRPTMTRVTTLLTPSPQAGTTGFSSPYESQSLSSHELCVTPRRRAWWVNLSRTSSYAGHVTVYVGSRPARGRARARAP